MSDYPKNFVLDQSSSEPLILIKSNNPYFAIIDCNAAFYAVSQTTGQDIIGKSMFELHTWNSENEESALLIHDLLMETIAKKEIITLPAVRYDLPPENGKKIEISWWQAVYEPIFNDDGSVGYILCITRNITHKMMNKESL